MGLLDLGRDILASGFIGEGSFTDFDNSNAQIAVGNGDTAFSSSQTALQGGSTESQGMESGYPDRTANAVEFRAVFGTADANFAWEEWAVTNGTQLINRAVTDMGTKTSATSRQITVTLTVDHSP